MRQIDAEVAVSVDGGDPVTSDTLVAADPTAVAGCDRVFDDAVDTGVGVDRVDVLEDRRADRSELRTYKRTRLFSINTLSVSFAREGRPGTARKSRLSFRATSCVEKSQDDIYSAAESSGIKFMRRALRRFSRRMLVNWRPAGSGARPVVGINNSTGNALSWKQAGQVVRAGRAMYVRLRIYGVQDKTGITRK